MPQTITVAIYELDIKGLNAAHPFQYSVPSIIVDVIFAFEGRFQRFIRGWLFFDEKTQLIKRYDSP